MIDGIDGTRCGWCVKRDVFSLGTATGCMLTGEHRDNWQECDIDQFVEDTRPLGGEGGQYPWVTPKQFESDGMTYATDQAIKAYVAKGGSVGDLMKLRIGGKLWIFPPPAERDEHELSDAAYSATPYGPQPEHRMARQMRELQERRNARQGKGDA